MRSTAHSSNPLVGVSACLLGQPVRYDGGHKRSEFLVGPLAEHVDFRPLCPEAAIGLGIPRPTIRLSGDSDRPRARGTLDPGMDVTDRLEAFANSQMGELANLSGFVLKKDSPSCGMERVKVYRDSGGSAQLRGSGIFARVLMQHYPLLPVEEEGRLNDAVLRENFVNRVFTYHEWHQLQASGLTRVGLIDFHTRRKYLVMAHSQAAYRRMGQLLSNLSGERLAQTAPLYIDELMTALKRRATRRNHVNALQHIMGYLERRIDAGDKAELGQSIEAYRHGETPLIAPITLLKHYFRRHPDPYMEAQIYLQPHPAKLGLRNHI